MRFRVGDIVRRADPYGRQPFGRLRVTGFREWIGSRLVQVELLNGLARYEIPVAELVHVDDAIVRLGRLAP